MRILDATQRHCREQCRIGRSGGGESWRSVLPARPDDDDDDDGLFNAKSGLHIYELYMIVTIFLYVLTFFFINSLFF